MFYRSCVNKRYMKVFNQTGKKGFSWFFIFLMLVHTTSCNFYQVEKLTRYDAFGIKNFRPADKKVIVHAGQETFMLSDFKLDSTFLSGNVTKIDSSWYFYKSPEHKFTSRYKTSQKEVLKEVHFYLRAGNINPPYVEIPWNNVEEIHVIKYDEGTSIVNTLVFTGGVIVILYYVILLASFFLFYRA